MAVFNDLLFYLSSRSRNRVVLHLWSLCTVSRSLERRAAAVSIPLRNILGHANVSAALIASSLLMNVELQIHCYIPVALSNEIVGVLVWHRRALLEEARRLEG